MRSFTTRVLLFALSAAALAGCSKNPVIQLPPPAAARMYVADLNNGLVVFTQPITASSTPSFTIPGAETAGVVFDSAGNLYVSNAGANTIAVYKSPVSATSVPTLVIGPITGAFDIEGLAFDSAGNLYAADEGGSQVLVLTPPFTAGVQAPAKALIGIPHGPIGVAFDRAGDMILPSYGSSVLTIYRPPFANGVNVAAGTITLPTGAGGVGMDTHDDLIAGQADGTLAIVKPPFATGSPVGPIIGQVFLINPPTCTFPAAPLCPAVESLNTTVDAAGNLWVPYGGDGGLAPPPPPGPPVGTNEFGIAEFVVPFSGASVSNFGLLQNGVSFPFSITWGP